MCVCVSVGPEMNANVNNFHKENECMLWWYRLLNAVFLFFRSIAKWILFTWRKVRSGKACAFCAHVILSFIDVVYIWCYLTNWDSILTGTLVYTIHNLISITGDTKRTIPGNVQNDSFVCMFALGRTANTEREKKKSQLFWRDIKQLLCVSVGSVCKLKKKPFKGISAS